MPRYKLIIEYDGAPFCGWQIQDNGASVQGALETAVKAICGEQVRVHGAGRTDKVKDLVLRTEFLKKA